MSVFKTEPVRVIGWFTSFVTLVVAIAAEVGTSWDTQTGWVGLVLAILIGINTELQRSQVTPVAKLRLAESGATPSVMTSTETLEEQ